MGVFENGRIFHMLRRILLVAAAFALYVATPILAAEITPQGAPRSLPDSASTDWIAFAVSTNGRVFKIEGGSELGARTAAKNECEHKTLRACSAIAVNTNSDVIAINCKAGRDQESFVGGSNLNVGAAEWIAYDKAMKSGYSRGDCREVYRY